MFMLQEDITAKMRGILIDWLIDVHAKFNLEANTLFITVNVIDRFLSKEKIQRKQLQLVGIAAMLIACKFEEIYAPEVRDFVYICDEVSAPLASQTLGLHQERDYRDGRADTLRHQVGLVLHLRLDLPPEVLHHVLHPRQDCVSRPVLHRRESHQLRSSQI